jgi:tripartite ATP-independent transporter DctM subunit
MEWWLALVIIFGGLFLLMATGMPVAFGFAFVNIVGMFVFMGGQAAFSGLILSMSNALTVFSLIPVPLFVLMGEVLWHSGIGIRAIDVLEKWLGRMPGRLSVISVVAGVIFAAVSGSNMANTALLGSVLGQDMEKRGYKKAMILGPIMGSGALAMMIPPSTLGVLCATIGKISVGKLLIAIIVPGLLLAALYALYIIIRCYLRPELAPSYHVAATPLRRKVIDSIKYLFPLAVIILLTVGLLFFGVATPSESAAVGCLGSCILGLSIGGTKWVKKSILGTLRVTVMAFTIIMSATVYSQLLAFSGASRGLVEFVVGMDVSPILTIILMQIGLILLGGPMEELTLMMIALPLYMPIVTALGFDPVWFGVLILLNVEIALLSPPFGMVLFVMKGVSAQDTTMGDVFRSAIPFCILQAIAMALIISFPSIALWLPKMMM